MKRVVSLMICALLLLGLGDNASAAEEDFAEAIGAQSFAAAMSFWNAEDPAFSESGNDRVWDMAGWYAAWMYRTEGWDLVGERQLEDFRRSIAVESESTPPGYWTEYGALRVLHGSDGADSYDFIQHKSDVDAMLGIYMAVSVTPAEGLGAIAEVRYYYENGGWDSWRYALEFAENPEADSAFAYRLTGVTPLSTEPELSGDLSFTWEELQAANGLDQILSVYPAVRISNLGDETEASTWLFQRGGETALVSEGTDYVSGQFHGCAFYLVTLGDGTQRARVGSYYESMSGQNSLEDYVLGYLVDIRTMELDRIEGDLIWTNCSCLGGNKETLAFDRGTLVLRVTCCEHLGNPWNKHSPVSCPLAPHLG